MNDEQAGTSQPQGSPATEPLDRARSLTVDNTARGSPLQRAASESDAIGKKPTDKARVTCLFEGCTSTLQIASFASARYRQHLNASHKADFPLSVTKLNQTSSKHSPECERLASAQPGGKQHTCTPSQSSQILPGPPQPLAAAPADGYATMEDIPEGITTGVPEVAPVGAPARVRARVPRGAPEGALGGIPPEGDVDDIPYSIA